MNKGKVYTVIHGKGCLGSVYTCARGMCPAAPLGSVYTCKEHLHCFTVLVASILLVTYSLQCPLSRLVLSGVQVITKQIDGHKCEPYEEAVIEVPEEHVGPVVDMLGQRKGQMLDLVAGETGGLTRSDPHFTPLAASATACA